MINNHAIVNIPMDLEPQFSGNFLSEKTKESIKHSLGGITEKIREGHVCSITLSSICNEKMLTLIYDNIAQVLGTPKLDPSGRFISRFNIAPENKSTSPLEDYSLTVHPHTDGVLLEQPYNWMLLSKITQKGLKGGDTTLVQTEDLISLCREMGIEPTEFYIPYVLPTYSCKRDRDVVPKTLPILQEKSHNRIVRFAWDMIDTQSLTTDQAQQISALNRGLNSIATSLLIPEGGCICFSNQHFLHGRRQFEVLSNYYRRILIRIRGMY